MTDKIQLVLKGMAMGIAEVIPGVSGGTIAFITGIYEKLLDSIKAFSPRLITVFKNEGLAGVWNAVNGTFLLSLLFGMGAGIVIGVFGVSHLLENYPPVIWAFFFGLIIASAIYIGRQVKQWNWKTILFLVLGAVIAYGITILSPSGGSTNLFFVFFCGMIAISALILPGISGSFILLMLGMYSYIVSDTLRAVLETFAVDKIIVMFVFALGCLTGLMTVSRVLSWTFKHYRSATLAILTGFMLGSLNKIWPWRNVTSMLNKETGELLTRKESILTVIHDDTYKVITEANVLPAGYDGEPFILWVVICSIVGFSIVFVLDRFSKKN